MSAFSQESTDFSFILVKPVLVISLHRAKDPKWDIISLLLYVSPAVLDIRRWRVGDSSADEI